MEMDDDLLEDLLSWTGDSQKTPVTSQTHSSLRESCVNTGGASGSHGKKSSAPTATQNDRKNTLTDLATTATTPQKQSTDNDTCPSSLASGTAASATQAGFALPTAVWARLMPHQRDGVQWLYTRHCKSRACLLADEMGLGKTVQVSAFLAELYRRKMIKTTILVVPPTLVPMWEAALLEWAGDESHRDVLQKMIEVVHNDPRKKRQARWRKLKFGLPCIFVTTYGVLRQDVADMSSTLVDYVVLDEAHLIKDSNTHAFKSALTLSARHKIALTGTPLMNSFDDMWSVFRFLDGAILSASKAEFNAVSATLLRGNEKDASEDQRGAAAAELTKLQSAIRPFMLRREKKDLTNAVTSEKQDVVVWVRLSAVQQQQYEAFLESKATPSAASSQQQRQQASSYLAEDVTDGDYGDGATNTSEEASTNPLLLLTMLSQICNHPWLNLVDEAFASAVKTPYAAPLPEMGDVFAGSKLWVALQLLLRCINEKRKALVFSRSKRLLKLMSLLLHDWGVSHTQVDGDTSSEHRFGEVRRFNESPDLWVCLLTTQVGGVGLTFTAASAVVLLDPSWNPSADAQAVDRVHRIGQTSDVVVYRLVTCGTVEEKVYRNQIFKRMAALQSMQAGMKDINEMADSAEALEMAGGKGLQRRAGFPPEEPSQPQNTSAGEEAEDLYRYFTRLQLRSMFVMDSVDRSSTAEQLEQLHPNHVNATLRANVTRIAGVCNVSDNSCVLRERVDPAKKAALGAASSHLTNPGGAAAAVALAAANDELADPREVAETAFTTPLPPLAAAAAAAAAGSCDGTATSPRTRARSERTAMADGAFTLQPEPQRRRVEVLADRVGACNGSVVESSVGDNIRPDDSHHDDDKSGADELACFGLAAENAYKKDMAACEPLTGWDGGAPCDDGDYNDGDDGVVAATDAWDLEPVVQHSTVPEPSFPPPAAPVAALFSPEKALMFAARPCELEQSSEEVERRDAACLRLTDVPATFSGEEPPHSHQETEAVGAEVADEEASFCSAEFESCRSSY